MVLYPGEEVGVRGAAAVYEAVLELPEHGVHRVLQRPTRPVRHHVNRVRPSRNRLVAITVLLRRHRLRRDLLLGVGGGGRRR